MNVVEPDDAAGTEKAKEVLRGMPESLVRILARSNYAPRGILPWIFASLEPGSKALTIAHGLVTGDSDAPTVTRFGSLCMAVAAEEHDEAFTWHHKMETIEKQHENAWGLFIQELLSSP